mgnify:CR=1 FL=1
MTAAGWALAIAIVLVVVSGLLIAAETAIGRVSRTAIEEHPGAGSPRSARLLAMLDDRARYVNALLFASTVTTVGATVLVADAVALTWDGSWGGLLIAVGGMTIVAYVFLGVAARTLGRQHVEGASLAFASMARGLAAILGPLPSLLILLGNALTPGKGYKQGPFASQAEFREMVDLAEAEDLIEDDEAQMIHSVFELGDTFAREVMVPRTEMVFVERTKTLRQALSLGLRSGYSRIPVVGDGADDVVGVAYLKDVARRVFEHHDAEQTERIESLMRQAYFVPDSKPVDSLLRDMQSARVHLAIVVDEFGGTAGLVTIEDILEEIVGEIADEYDTAAPEVTEIAPGTYRVHSRMHVDDFAELVGLELGADDEGVDTVLGLMAKRLGRVPIAGAQADIDGWRLTAEQGGGRRHLIATVHATRLPAADDARSSEAQ